jgi:hypothetical protein
MIVYQAEEEDNAMFPVSEDLGLQAWKDIIGEGYVRKRLVDLEVMKY